LETLIQHLYPAGGQLWKESLVARGYLLAEIIVYLCRDMERFLECCCTSVEEVLKAQRLGASRIELCSHLEIGGTSPSHELLTSVLAVARIPVNVLIRPLPDTMIEPCTSAYNGDAASPYGFTAADFVYDETGVQRLISDIQMCSECSSPGHAVAGIVTGALTPSGAIDVLAMKRLISEARSRGFSVTFHRAFDVCSDPLSAFEDVLGLGCERLLTSGHKPKANEGADLIATLVRKAGSRIIVMPGSGIRRSNLELIASRTGASEFHASSAFFE